MIKLTSPETFSSCCIVAVNCRTKGMEADRPQKEGNECLTVTNLGIPPVAVKLVSVPVIGITEPMCSLSKRRSPHLLYPLDG